MPPGPVAFFQPAAAGGQRLYLHHPVPAGAVLRGVVLYVHPWAEEMNKSRRMAALTSRALATQGWVVLQVDLLGCGDSTGDFGDAHWDAWVDDVVTAAQWLDSRYPGMPMWLWGLRAGALLACGAAGRLPRLPNLLFWQPVSQGKSAWQQFLRLKAAAQLADGGGKAVLDLARADLAAGRPINIAGYTVLSPLAQGLQSAVLAPPAADPMAAPAGTAANAPARASSRMVWLEVSSQTPPAPGPAAVTAMAPWQAAGWHTDLRAVQGPPFWHTTEIEEAPELLQATLEALAA